MSEPVPLYTLIFPDRKTIIDVLKREFTSTIHPSSYHNAPAVIYYLLISFRGIL